MDEKIHSFQVNSFISFIGYSRIPLIVNTICWSLEIRSKVFLISTDKGGRLKWHWIKIRFISQLFLPTLTDEGGRLKWRWINGDWISSKDERWLPNRWKHRGCLGLIGGYQRHRLGFITWIQPRWDSLSCPMNTDYICEVPLDEDDLKDIQIDIENTKMIQN